MALQRLIVQLPGIGGSVLAADGAPAWDVSRRRLAMAVIRPEALSLDVDLQPVGLTDSMTLIPGLVAIPGYAVMVENLRRWFGAELRVVDYLPGRSIPSDTDVLRVPYDFRRSIADAAETLDRAVAAAGAAAERGVVVLAHSIGGLVARYWSGVMGGARLCRALVTLGTPHRGAPKALDVLVNGLAVGRLVHPAATRVLREWPSMAELLPQYPAVWRGGKAVEPPELPAECVRAFRTSDAGPRLLERAAAAAEVHREIAAGWARERLPDLAPLYARGHFTLNRAEVIAGRLQVTKADPEWRPNPGWRGDGTVPMISAVPGELSNTRSRWHGAAEKHGALAGTLSVKELLTTLMGEDLPYRHPGRAAGDDALGPDRPWIGFDLADVVWAGDPIQLGAEVLGDVDGPGVAASVTIAGMRSIPMTQHEGRWHASLPPMLAGVYEVTVQADEADHGAAVWGTAPLVVAEPDDGWEYDEPRELR